MLEIHIIHKRWGGAGQIISLLEKRGDTALPAKLSLIIKYINCNNSKIKIYFHQPYSHLICLVLKLIYQKSQTIDFYCILHEASDYNIDDNNFSLRAYITYTLRIIVIRLCYFMGIKLVGVSRFVCDSYHLPTVTISYAHLLKGHLTNDFNVSIKKDFSGVVWLRPGDSIGVLNIVKKLIKIKLLSSLYILGNDHECKNLRTLLIANSIGDDFILNRTSKLTHSDFIGVLTKSTWFISFFPKEGFGLSAFEATFLGCIVLANPNQGSLKEWLPRENFDMLKQINLGIKVPSFAEIQSLSQINHLFAKEYMDLQA